MPLPRTPPIFKRRAASADNDHDDDVKTSNNAKSSNQLSANEKKCVEITKKTNVNDKRSSVNESISMSTEQDGHKEQEESNKNVESDESSVRNNGQVGRLVLQLHRASGLPAGDFGRACSACVQLTLGQAKLRSATIRRSADPIFEESFELPLDDVTDVLYVDVVDQERFHEPQIVGRLAIPVLQVVKMEPNLCTSFFLKDKKLSGRCKGNSARLYFSFQVDYDFFKAALKTISKPRQLIAKSAFRKNTFVRNVRRVKGIVDAVTAAAKVVADIFSWEDPQRTVKCFVAFEVAVFFGEIYMLPVALILVIFGYPLWSQWIDLSSLEPADVDDDDYDDNDDKNENKGLGDRVRTIQELSAYVQNGLGFVASTVERVVNTVNFSEPFMSWLAVAFLALVTLVLYWVPLRALIMLWGLNKFSKKLINPNYKPNSELLSFLSRVPDEVLKRECEPLLPVEDTSNKDEEEERMQKGKSKGKIAKKVSAFFSREKENSPVSDDLSQQHSSGKAQQ